MYFDGVKLKETGLRKLSIKFLDIEGAKKAILKV